MPNERVPVPENMPWKQTMAELTREPVEQHPDEEPVRYKEVLRWVDTEDFYDLLMEQQEQM